MSYSTYITFKNRENGTVGLEVGIVVVLVEERRVVIGKGPEGNVWAAGVLFLHLVIGYMDMFAL